MSAACSCSWIQKEKITYGCKVQMDEDEEKSRDEAATDEEMKTEETETAVKLADM